MLDGLDFDPYTVLGISRNADAEDIREAFRRKSKKHHPDLGGDEWAFRIVVRAYELLTGGRKPAPRPSAPSWPAAPTSAADFGFTRATDADADADAEPPPDPGEARDWAAETERVRPGVQDRDVAPIRMVLVEVLWLRMEVSDIYALLQRREESHFSGSLHIRWPDPEVDQPPSPDPAELHMVLGALSLGFETLRARPGVVNARSRVERGRFEAWLSYASGRDAWNAFNTLRPLLNQGGLGVRQITRDLTIPRETDKPD